MLAKDEAEGANVYRFDPEDSPAKKAAPALRAAQEKLAPMQGAGNITAAGLVQGTVVPTSCMATG